MTNYKSAWSRMAAAVAVTVTIGMSTPGGAGTVALLKDLADDEIIAGTDPWYLGVSGNRALLAGSVPGEQGRALFRTDGTAGGTARINVAGIVDPERVVTVGNRVLFVAYSNPSHQDPRLWSSDGTEAGTLPIRSIGAGSGAYRLGTAAGGRVYLCIGDVLAFSSGCELFISDGTEAGTVRLTTNQTVRAANTDAAGNLYFSSSDSTGANHSLWMSDGTVGGTRPLHTFVALGFLAIGPIAWVDAQNLYVNADRAGFERGLYRVNIATGAVERLALNGFSSFAQNAIEMNGARYFLMDDRIWGSDGTPAGTIDLGPAVMPFVTYLQMSRLGNRIVFMRNDPATGMALWATDGTPGGTQILVDAAPGPDGFTQLLAATADRAFFLSGEFGDLRFWVTDGTPGGTRLIPRTGGGTPSVQGVAPFVTGAVVAGTVYLQATVNAQLPGGVVTRDRLFATDLAGTSLVDLDFAGTQIEPFGTRALFSNWGDPVGNEPWITDGTVAGTARIADLAVSGQTDHSSPWAFTRVGPRVFFTAQDRAHGRELWVTDGTAANTRRLTDINAGEGHSMPLDSRLESAGGLLYFIASSTLNSGDEMLWRSDGTEAGTFALGGISAHAPQCGRWTAEWNGRVWFFGRTGQGSLAELWSTNGTAAGTRREAELPPAIQFLPPCNLHATPNGIVIASGYVATAGTLWRSDGTETGTIRLGDILPAGAGPGPGSLPYLAKAGDFIYLLAESVAAGRELWRTDGTAAGTTLVSDLTPGDTGALDFAIAPFGTGVLFSYRSAPGTVDGLWRIASPGATPELVKAGRTGTRLPVVGSDAYFTFSDAGTESLWITDGTSAGSREVVNPGAGLPLGISQFAAGETFLFFSRSVTAFDEQVWFTNGQASGTHRLSSFAPGTFSMNPDVVVLNDRALFYRDDGVHGGEPFVVVNQPPVAVADAVVTAQGVSVVVNVRANDSDPDSSASIVSLAVVTPVANGTLVADGANYRYAPNAGFSGADSFEYRLTDEFGAQSAVVRVTITVTAAPATGGAGGGGKKKGGGGLDVAMLASLLASWMLSRALARRGRT